MADQANFYVKNDFTGKIDVYRELPGGSRDLEKTIDAGSTEMFPMQGMEVKLVVNTPGGKSTNGCYINVVPGNGLPVSCEQAVSGWELQIEPNNLPPDSPTTVNVDAGEDE